MSKRQNAHPTPLFTSKRISELAEAWVSRKKVMRYPAFPQNTPKTEVFKFPNAQIHAQAIKELHRS